MSEEKPKKKRGAPELPYDANLMDELCFELSISRHGLDHILAHNKKYPSRETVYKWLFNIDEFAEKYRRAKEKQQDFLLDTQDLVLEEYSKYTYRDKEGNERIDAPAIALAKLKCDNIKWTAARVAARKYGNQIPDQKQLATQEDIKESNEKLSKLIEKHAKEY